MPAIGGLRASKLLHAFLLHHVVAAPLRYFDTTPVGRIMSRFSKDIDTLDQLLPQLIINFVWLLFEVTKTRRRRIKLFIKLTQEANQ